MRTLFNKVLLEIAEKDERIYMILADIGYGEIEPLPRAPSPTASSTVGVAEQNMTGVACGVAMEGNIAITYSIANFPTLRCLEQIRNDVCYHNANVKIVIIGGGLAYGALGVSHQATEDIAIMRALPNMVVRLPLRLRRGRGGHPRHDRPRRAGLLPLRLQEGAGGARGPDRLPLGKAIQVRDGTRRDPDLHRHDRQPGAARPPRLLDGAGHPVPGGEHAHGEADRPGGHPAGGPRDGRHRDGRGAQRAGRAGRRGGRGAGDEGGAGVPFLRIGAAGHVRAHGGLATSGCWTSTASRRRPSPPRRSRSWSARK